MPASLTHGKCVVEVDRPLPSVGWHFFTSHFSPSGELVVMTKKIEGEITRPYIEGKDFTSVAVYVGSPEMEKCWVSASEMDCGALLSCADSLRADVRMSKIEEAIRHAALNPIPVCHASGQYKVKGELIPDFLGAILAHKRGEH